MMIGADTVALLQPGSRNLGAGSVRSYAALSSPVTDLHRLPYALTMTCWFI
jgi:hypothetical protein